MKEEVVRYLVIATLWVFITLCVGKWFDVLYLNWCKITSILWVGLPLIGAISGLIDVCKYYNKK